MTVSINTRSLPGIGVCQEITLNEGSRLGIVTRRSGLRDLVVYDRRDDDEALVDVVLSESEANAIAELLGGPQMFASLQAIDETDGLVVEQLPIDARSPYAARPLGDTKARTRTGVSIVAVLRDGAVCPSPGPDFMLAAGDLVAVVGMQPAIDALAAIIDGTDTTDRTADTSSHTAGALENRPPGQERSG
ncbi:MAG: cation:proton antiporter regulatory subunit [Jatrophihabitans sp.]